MRCSTQVLKMDLRAVADLRKGGPVSTLHFGRPEKKVIRPAVTPVFLLCPSYPVYFMPAHWGLPLTYLLAHLFFLFLFRWGPVNDISRVPCQQLLTLTTTVCEIWIRNMQQMVMQKRASGWSFRLEAKWSTANIQDCSGSGKKNLL